MFSVNYGTRVKLTTLLIGGLLLGMAIYGGMKYRNGLPFVIGMIVLPVCTLAACALFTVRGYEVKDGALYVMRLIGTLRITDKVQVVIGDDRAMAGATRIWGNAGLFSICGWFILPNYGSARVWVTDMAKLVVVKGAAVTAVISPSDRERFLDLMRRSTTRPHHLPSGIRYGGA